MVLVGLTTIWSLATFPTSRSPLAETATTDGRMRFPRSVGTTLGMRFRTDATQVLVVPRSIPTMRGFSAMERLPSLGRGPAPPPLPTALEILTRDPGGSTMGTLWSAICPYPCSCSPRGAVRPHRCAEHLPPRPHPWPKAPSRRMLVSKRLPSRGGCSAGGLLAGQDRATPMTVLDWWKASTP